MMSAALIALAPQAAHAAAGSKSFTIADGLSQDWTVPANVHNLRVEVKGAAGGSGGLEGGSGGRGASGTVTVAVNPDQVITVNLGERGSDADPDVNTGFGPGGNSAALGKGGSGGSGGANSGAGGGGGGATEVLLDGDLVATAGAGGGGGGTGGGTFGTQDGGNGGGAGQDGSAGSVPAAGGGHAGDAASQIGGTGDTTTTANNGGAGGGGGGYQGGGQGAAVTSSTGSGAGGGGGGTSYVNTVLAELEGSWASDVDGNGAVTITYETAFEGTVEIADPGAVVTGEDKDYTVSVTSDSAEPATGEVKLTARKSGASTVIDLGTADLNNGTATIARGGLLVGDYTLTASYTPDAASDTLAGTVERAFSVVKGNTQTLIAGPATPPNLGDSVDLGVSVAALAPANGTPSGQVKFFQGAAAIPGGTVTLDASGNATLTTTQLVVGAGAITAEYLGDDQFETSVDDTSLGGFVVNSGDVSVTLHAEHGSVIVGEKSKLVVDVASLGASSTKPTGDVQLMLDDEELGAPQGLDANGRAIFFLELPVTSDDGHHHIRAVYAGDANYDPATSNWIDHAVNIGEASVSLISDVNPSQVGDPVIFDIDVNGLIPAKPYEPTGKVQLYVNDTPFNAPVDIDADGRATIALDALPLGTTTVWARYLGDDSYKPASSEALVQIVKKRNAVASTTTIDAPGAAVTGQSKSYRITVEAAVAGVVPTGSVSLTAESHADGTITALGSKNLLGGTATIHKDGLRVGTYTLLATYQPDAASDVMASAGEQELVVDKGESQTLIAGPADVPNVGESVDFGVIVKAVAPAKGIPSGQVRFYQDGTAIPGGLVTLDASGQAVLTTTKLKVGSANITARYLGDDEFNASEDVDSLVDFVVNAGDVEVTLAAEHDAVIAGEKSKLVVDVAAPQGAVKPTGDVQLYLDDELLGAAQPVNPATGRTTFVLELPVTNPNGHHHIRAVYAGDDNYQSAISNWIDHVVNFGDAQVELTSDVNPSNVGNDVTFSIDVDGLRPTRPYEPTGQVQLYVNGTPFNAPVDIDANGWTSITTDDLPVGTVDVSATYLGDDKYKPANSAVLQQVVKQQTATVTLTSSAAQLQFGQPLTLTATVTTDDPDGKPTGEVQFYDHGRPFGSPVLVDDNGKATITTTKAVTGVHQFSAKYLGDDDTVEGVSATVEVTVKANTLKFKVITDKIPAFSGEDVLLHARLITNPGSKGKVAGSLQYYNNGDKVGRPVPVNGAKWGSLVVRRLKPGTHRFTAIFTPSSASTYSAAAGTGVIQRVLKGKPNAKVKMSIRRTSGSTAEVRVKVRKVKGGAATGNVQIYVDGKPVKLLKLPSNGSYRVYTVKGLTERQAFITGSYRGKGKLRQASKSLTLPGK